MSQSSSSSTVRPAWVLAALLATLAGAGYAQEVAVSACGPLENQYGPFDYRTQREKLKVVEAYHFNAGVEFALRGQSSNKVAGDLSYLMRTSPNHHRGLLAVVRLARNSRSPQPLGLQYSVECYFERAIRFQPDDTVVRALYAQYLHSERRTGDAKAQLDAAVVYAEDKPLSHYNIGLVYFDIGEYHSALAQAHKVRSMGFENDGLEQRLRSAGKWRDPS
jgi:tetratricopeptide (TPR) repeat protein